MKIEHELLNQITVTNCSGISGFLYFFVLYYKINAADSEISSFILNVHVFFNKPDVTNSNKTVKNCVPLSGCCHTSLTSGVTSARKRRRRGQT